MAKRDAPLAWDDDEKFPPPLQDSKIIQMFDPIKVKVYFKRMPKIMDGEEIVLSPETETMLVAEAKTCFVCRIILEDHAKNGKLTGHPNDIFEKGTFPVESKIRHIQIVKLHAKKVGQGAEPPAPEEEKGETDATE